MEEFEKDKKEKKKNMIKKLKHKHECEKSAMQLKIISKLEEHKLNKAKEEAEINHRHQNALMEFKGGQEKENLCRKGKFTSRGGKFEKSGALTRLKSLTSSRSLKKEDWSKESKEQ